MINSDSSFTSQGNYFAFTRAVNTASFENLKVKLVKKLFLSFKEVNCFQGALFLQVTYVELPLIVYCIYKIMLYRFENFLCRNSRKHNISV